MRKQNKQGFTLVELIVVITVLAILGTIAFISLQGYSAQSRDTKRVSDISNIKKSLELFSLNTGKYPLPDSGIEVSYSGELLRTQGTVGDQVTTNLSKNLNEKPIDPLTESEYTYSTTHSQTEFEVLGLYESDMMSFLPHPNPPLTGEGTRTSVISSSNAAKQDYPKIDGNYNGIYVKNSNFYVPTPSIINGNIWGNTELFGTTLLQSQIITGGDNIPLTSTGWLNINLSVYTGTITEESTDTEKSNLVQAIQTAYTDSQLSSDTMYADILSRTSTGEMVDFVDLVVLNGANGTNVSADTTWCYYKNNTFSDTLGWTSNELKYDETTETCYVFGDENTNAINACNAWVLENISSSVGDFIWVPARYFITDGNGTGMSDSYYEREVTYNGNDYVCRGFSVAKYEMSYDEETASDSSNLSWDTRAYNSSKTPVSIANRLPIADISQVNAISQCSSIGTHLITNNEWMVISRNIEQQGINWSNGSIGDGYIYNGIDNIASANIDWTIGCYDDDNIYADPTGGSTCSLERQLSLSNGTKIWDLAGNVWEHVNKTNDILNTTGTNGIQTELTTTDYWIEFTDIGIDNIERGKYGPSISTYDYTNGIGKIYDTAVADNIFLRGGNAFNVPHTGIYTLYLHWWSGYYDYNVGFRCVK